MAYWEFKDGTVVRSSGLVQGNAHFAQYLRKALLGLINGNGPLVWMMEARDGPIDLDPNNHRLLNPLRNQALLEGVGPETGCAPKVAAPQTAAHLPRKARI